MVVETILAASEIVKLAEKLNELLQKRKVRAIKKDSGKIVEGEYKQLSEIQGERYIEICTSDGTTVKIPILETDRLELPSVEDKKQFEEDKKKLMELSPEGESDVLKRFLEENDEALTMIEIFRERGAVDTDRITSLLNKAGFDATIRDVRRLLVRLEELGGVEKINLDSYRLSKIGEKVIV